jgi:putative MATE family efflux protein
MQIFRSQNFENRTLFLLSASPLSILYRIALPNVAGIAMMTVVTFFDAWFVGQLGTEALASLALIFPFQALMQMMAGGAIGGGITSAIARATGRGEQDFAKRIAFNGLFLGAGMSFIYTVIFCVFPEYTLGLLRAPSEIIGDAIKYAKVGFGGAIFTWAFFVLSSTLRGVGDTSTPAKVILVTGCLQIVISGFLTLGILPGFDLGFVGPAASLVICHLLASLYLLTKIIRTKSLFTRENCVLDWCSFATILKVGGLGLINSVTIALTVVVVTNFVGRFGVGALAGYGLGSRLELMLIPISFGVGAALTAAVGTNIGANQYQRAKLIAKTGAFVTFVTIGIFGLLVSFMPWIWIDLFIDFDNSFLFASTYLTIVGPFYGFFAGGMTLYFASQGTGTMIFPVLVNVVRLFVVLITCGATLTLQLDIQWLFIGISLGLLVTGTGQFLCLYSSPWNKTLK